MKKNKGHFDPADEPPCRRTSCFGNSSRKCRILRHKDFKDKNCKFFKTKEQFKAENERRLSE